MKLQILFFIYHICSCISLIFSTTFFISAPLYFSPFLPLSLFRYLALCLSPTPSLPFLSLCHFIFLSTHTSIYFLLSSLSLTVSLPLYLSSSPFPAVFLSPFLSSSFNSLVCLSLSHRGKERKGRVEQTEEIFTRSISFPVPLSPSLPISFSFSPSLPFSLPRPLPLSFIPSLYSSSKAEKNHCHHFIHFPD